MSRATDDADADVEIVDGKLTMAADGAAAIYLTTPDVEPLGPEQRHATLRIVGEEYQATVAIDAEGLTALADAVSTAHDRWGDGR